MHKGSTGPTKLFIIQYLYRKISHITLVLLIKLKEKTSQFSFPKLNQNQSRLLSKMRAAGDVTLFDTELNYLFITHSQSFTSYFKFQILVVVVVGFLSMMAYHYPHFSN